jgi:hypothetical protein
LTTLASKTAQLNESLDRTSAPWILVTDADARVPPDALKCIPALSPGTFFGTNAKRCSVFQPAAFVGRNPVAFAETYVSGIATTLVHPGTGAMLRLFVANSWETSPSVTQMITLGRWPDAGASQP